MMPKQWASSYLFEVVVCSLADGVQGGADVVEDGKHTGRSTSFDELANDLVIKVVDGRPFDALLHVFFLCLRGETTDGVNCSFTNDLRANHGPQLQIFSER